VKGKNGQPVPPPKIKVGELLDGRAVCVGLVSSSLATTTNTITIITITINITSLITATTATIIITIITTISTTHMQSEHACDSVDALLTLVDTAAKRRKTATTEKNSASSRYHPLPIASHSTTQHHHTAPHSTTQHHTAPHRTTQHHTAPHCTTQHHTALGTVLHNKSHPFTIHPPPSRSRSHGVGMIKVKHGGYAKDCGPAEGILYVIDLAGSERTADSKNHDKVSTCTLALLLFCH
jgi:hypothetical protein